MYWIRSNGHSHRVAGIPHQPCPGTRGSTNRAWDSGSGFAFPEAETFASSGFQSEFDAGILHRATISSIQPSANVCLWLRAWRKTCRVLTMRAHPSCSTLDLPIDCRGAIQSQPAKWSPYLSIHRNTASRGWMKSLTSGWYVCMFHHYQWRCAISLHAVKSEMAVPNDAAISDFVVGGTEPISFLGSTLGSSIKLTMAHTRTHTHIHTYTHAHTCKHAHTPFCTKTHLCTNTHAHKHTHMQTHIHIVMHTQTHFHRPCSSVASCV